MDRDTLSQSQAGLRWPALVLLFFLPLVLGLTFQTDGSGSGDGAAYREGVCYIETEGQIPLARLEWSHPLHILASWSSTRLLSWFGLAQDPHYAIHLLNFLALGLLALVLARTWFLYDPDRGRAFLAGLCVALLPGWAWCAQEPLSDVSGHSLVAISICMLLALQARIRDHRPHLLTALLAAFTAGIAFLFRPSAGLFLPLFLWLGVEALVQARSSRVRLALAFFLGALLPIIGVYLHFILRYGSEELLAIHLPTVVHNLAFRGFPSVLGLIKDWFHRSHHGLGLYAFLLACTGWLTWLLVGDWRRGVQDPASDKQRIRRVFMRPFFLFVLGLLPYFIFLLGNPAAGRFRFSLPVQLALVLGIVPLLGHLQKLRPGPWFAPFVSVFAAATLFQSVTLLSLFASKHHFVEAGALEISKLSKTTDLLLGHQSTPYLTLRESYRDLLAGGWGNSLTKRRKGAQTHGVRYDSEEVGRDSWNWNWRQTEREMLKALARDGRVLYFNEFEMGGFREWLALRGFGERSLVTLSAENLRNRMDVPLKVMSRLATQVHVDLEVLQVEGPEARLEPGLDKPSERVTARASRHPGLEYRLLAGHYSEEQETEFLGVSVPMDAQVSKPQVLDTGRLGDRGEAFLSVDPTSRPQGEVWLLLIMGENGKRVLARSQLFFPHPTDDRSPDKNKTTIR